MPSRSSVLGTGGRSSDLTLSHSHCPMRERPYCQAPLWCESNTRQHVSEWTRQHLNKLYFRNQVVGQIWPLHSLPTSAPHQQLPSRKWHRKCSTVHNHGKALRHLGVSVDETV
ncbi:hypothetical protein CapIbe_012030 [Capra ibex]